MANEFVQNILSEWRFQNYLQTFRGNVFVSTCFRTLRSCYSTRASGYGKMRNAEYRCGMAIRLGLVLGSWVRVRVMARAWVRVFIAILCNSAQFYTFHIAQNGYGGKTRG